MPGLAAAVVRRGVPVWSDGVGTADVDSPRVPGPDDQFLIASNTKSFTAVLVMALRDEGKLDLDDTLDQHLPGVTHAPPCGRPSPTRPAWPANRSATSGRRWSSPTPRP